MAVGDSPRICAVLNSVSPTPAHAIDLSIHAPGCHERLPLYKHHEAHTYNVCMDGCAPHIYEIRRNYYRLKIISIR